MNILFVHQNMPGQYKHLAAALGADPKHRVVFLTKRKDVDLPGVIRATYQIAKWEDKAKHRYIRTFEDAVLHGQAVARACLSLGKKGFRPDLIVGHPGWGETLFLKDIYPEVPLLSFCEFFYRGRGLDVGFDPHEPAELDDILRTRARSAHLLIALEACDKGVSPTHWQKSTHPLPLQDKINVIFDGIDTNIVRPDPRARFALADGRVLTRDDEVLTYLARNLEPYRGFHTFMRALPAILDAQPNAQVLIVGGDDVSYGRKPPDGRTWRETLLDEVSFDRSRVHFLGMLPYARYLNLLQVSSLHLYLTRPFVLSWSCIEAMAAGCAILGSRTAPVEEVIADGRNGFLVDFHDSAAIAARAAELLERRADLQPIRDAARADAQAHYALSKCLPEQLALMASMV